MRFKNPFSFTAIGLGVALAATGAFAQPWTTAYTSPTATGDCSALPAALNTGFTTTTVVSRAKYADLATVRILKMAFWLQPGAQYNDIYMIEKGTAGSARVLYYNGVDSTLKVIGTLTGINYGGNGVDEQGLLGITLNPVSFGTDNFLYLFYAVGTTTGTPSATNGWRVSRFTIDPNTKMINMASEKAIITIPASHNGRWHTGGALAFDNFGNLYIGTGDNEALAMGPGNTADLRGAVLRIKPDDSPRGYSIPTGNFGEYWAQKWQDSGLVTRAAEYRDTSKVKPEIYVKGSRNPYALSVDRHRLGWLEWSECGPDQQRSEEHNFTTKPAFSGWPFWAGSAVRQAAKAGSYGETPEPDSSLWTPFNPTSMSTQVPVNNWHANTGVDTLPPMHVPAHAYTGANGTTYAGSTCAAGGGPIIRYNGAVSNPRKMPPHLDNVVMFSDFTGSRVFARKINPTTAGFIDTAFTVFTMTKSGRPNINNPVDFQQGADGSLYMVDWGTGCCSSGSSTTNNGIVRISYTGLCQDPGLTVNVAKSVERGSVDWLRVGRSVIDVKSEGAHTVKILDLKGRLLQTMSGSGNREYAMPQSLSAGTLYVLRVETSLGIAVRTFSRF